MSDTSATPALPAALTDAALCARMKADALRQLDFFRASLRSDGGFDVLDYTGTPLPGHPQELHTTTRLVHSYALGKIAGARDCEAMIDAGVQALASRHHDKDHGGYVWAITPGGISNGDKLAYGHMFVLLAASSAHAAGHPDAARLLDDADAVITRHFWDDSFGLLRDEFRRDWQPFSTYRGMNANMHGVEALLAAYEATGRDVFLNRAGRILDFFVGRMAPAHGWRLPEHYTDGWQVDTAYSGNPMFRPHGTTPGHSFELGRLLIQYWDLCGRPAGDAPQQARKLIETALADAWLPDGGFAYTLDFSGRVAVADRYWWPVTEAISAVATLIRLDSLQADIDWYHRLWATAFALFVDEDSGGWFPEVDAAGQKVSKQFAGKPDIYHALQADLFPMAPGVSGSYKSLEGMLG